MPVPLAPPVTLGCDAQSHLESIVRVHSTPQALVLRCQLILRTAAHLDDEPFASLAPAG